MFVNKINGVSNLGFKGYQHVKNNVGETVMRFYYPYDSDNETCEIHFFRAIPTENYNHKIIETPIAVVPLKPDGVDVDLQDLTNLDKDAPFAYKVVRRDKKTGNLIWEGADTGVKIKPSNGEYVVRTKVHEDLLSDPISNYKYTLVSRKGTTPMVQGAGYLVTPDSLMPGAMYRGFTDENTGEIYYDESKQKNMEGVIKNFSNIHGGSMAGIPKIIPYLKQNGYSVLFSTPIANGSNGWSLGYWNKNNFQVSSNMGNTENFNSMFTDLYKNGMKYVFDGTFTSEGLEGVHFQYALRWAENNPQSYYWFRMNSLKDSSLGYGVIPKNQENLRHRIVNAPYTYELGSDNLYHKKANPNYNPNKETLCQIYDSAQASERQIKDYDKAIINYEKLNEGKSLDINSHDDTLINYVWQIRDFNEYEKNIDRINQLRKSGKDITLNSPDGSIMALNFSNFKIDRKTEGGFVTWDANTDMVKMNYHISGYDEKLLQSIVSDSMRAHERKMIERGTKEVQDMALQAGKYWTGKVHDIQMLYSAKTIAGAKTLEDLEKLVKAGNLPDLKDDKKIDSKTLGNILNGYYNLAPKGVLSKDDVTVKALMKMPLDALELGENTVGVLSTSYFSNRATTDETVGVSRFDLMKQDNPHLVEPYAKNYNKVNSLFNNELKNFADSIIKKVDETSNEKLLDSSGNYTEYGEYVIELVGQDIMKYAFLKSLGGDSFKTKLLKNGEITYDYETLQEGTTLKTLGINASSPEQEAALLESKIKKGLNTLTNSDVTYIADSILKRISGTDTSSFRIAEAWVSRAAIGLDWRLDAAKDVMDMDAIRNGDNSFDDNWDDVIQFWSKFVQTIKSENPDSYIVAEITDIPELMKDTYGASSHPFADKTNLGQKFNGEPDAFAKFFAQTGITSEAGYSYFFTDLLTNFAPSFETGDGTSPTHDRFKPRFDLLMECRSVDYLRNLYTFMGNHDKPRLLHGLAVDMKMFHSNILGSDGRGHSTREAAIQVLSGAKSRADIPIELRLNVDNNDYFLTISPRAVAVSKLLLDVINEDKSISEEDKKLLIDAIVDLTNGNYLGEGVTENMRKIKIKELSSIDNALKEIVSLAGVNLTSAEIDSIVKKANDTNLENYLVHGDFDWTSLSEDQKQKNSSYASEILGARSDYSEYSLYTVQLARLIKDSLSSVKPNVSIDSGLKAFVEKYNKATVSANSDEYSRIIDSRIAMKQNGYAARDLRTSLDMLVKQAEFKSGKQILNKQSIIDNLYKSATEPAVAKASMIMEFLKGLPGIPTMYSGDELGMTGYEEKAKNVYLQNRNVLPWSETEGNSDIAKYRKSVMASMNGALNDRSNADLMPLNNGTPYAVEVSVNGKTRSEIQQRINELWGEINKAEGEKKKQLIEEQNQLRKELSKVAYMMQSSNGDMTVTVFDAGGVDFSNRCNYFEKISKEYNVDLSTVENRKKFFEENNIESINPDNPYIPITPKSELDMIVLGSSLALPVGTVFTSANAKNKIEYVVKRVNDKLGIVRKDGGKIIMDGVTAKNGVMILKHVKNIAFKGSAPKRVYYNKQYNFVSNPYVQKESMDGGKNFSVIAK